MKLYQLVFKDILRRKKRVLYATLGVVIATMTVVGVLTIAVAGRTRIYLQLEKYGPNLTVVPATRSLNASFGDLSLGTLTVGENYIPMSVLPRIREITDSEIKEALTDDLQKALNINIEGNIAAVAPQLLLQASVKGAPVILAGLDPVEEWSIKTWWKVKHGRYFDGPGQALLGAFAAESLDLKIGDVVPLNGETVTVTGILEESGSEDDYQIFVPLPLLQKAYGKEGLVSTVDIRALCTACPVEVIADAINKEIPGVRAVAVKQVADTEMGMLQKINNLMLALGAVTLLVGGFGVVNTLMSSVHERIKDIGIMRAVGASRRQIIRAFIYEAVVIGVLGGIAGYGLGTLLALFAGPLIFEGAAVHLVPGYFLLSLALAIFIAVIATLYPAFKATKIRVADSFRSL